MTSIYYSLYGMILCILCYLVATLMAVRAAPRGCVASPPWCKSEDA